MTKQIKIGGATLNITDADNALIEKIRVRLGKLGIAANATDAVRYALNIAAKEK